MQLFHNILLASCLLACSGIRASPISGPDIAEVPYITTDIVARAPTCIGDGKKQGISCITVTWISNTRVHVDMTVTNVKGNNMYGYFQVQWQKESSGKKTLRRKNKQGESVNSWDLNSGWAGALVAVKVWSCNDRNNWSDDCSGPAIVEAPV